MISRKTAAAATLAMLLAGTSGLAIAQQTTTEQGKQPAGAEQRKQRWQPPSQEVIQRMIDGRLAGAKAALKLSPDQEKLWPAVENVIRQNAADRMKTREEMRRARTEGSARLDLIQRLESASSRMETRATQVKRLAEALKPLYATLSDDQKRVLRMSMADATRFGYRSGRGHHRHRG